MRVNLFMKFVIKPIFLIIFVVVFSCKSGDKEKSALNGSTFSALDSLNGLDVIWIKYKFTKSEVEQYPDMIEQSLVDYLSAFPSNSFIDIDSSLNRLIERTENEPVFFYFLKEKISSYLYHPNSPMRNDLYFEQVLQAYQNSDLLNDNDKKRDQLILELVQKNQVGEEAADFYFINREGQKKSMSSFIADRKLIIFYDPKCSHCNETLNEMKQSDILNKEIFEKKMILLAIDPIGNLKNWEEYNSKIPSNWMNGIDTHKMILKESLYNIQAYPTIYLLDRDNKVILKDVYFTFVENYLLGNE